MLLTLPADLTATQASAVALLFACWFLYSAMLRLFGRGSLNTQLGIVRRYWISAATRRAAKPFDAVLLGHLIHANAFFGSATLIVLAGVITSFTQVKTLHQTISQLHFVAPASVELFALQLGVLAFVLALCFFSFTYALRKLVYTLALFGALPDVADDCPTLDGMVTATTTVLTEAIKTFNFGIRGYYYAVAALCLFVSPYACMTATLVVTAALFYRQLMTPTARAIQEYVEAAKSIRG